MKKFLSVLLVGASASIIMLSACQNSSPGAPLPDPYTMVFQNPAGAPGSYTGVTDTYMDSYNSMSNTGQCAYLLCGADYNTYPQVSKKRALIHVNMNGYIPVTTTAVVSAKLGLYVNTYTQSNFISVYALTSSFWEGTGACTGTDSSMGYASWIMRNLDGMALPTGWTNPGGDYNSTVKIGGPVQMTAPNAFVTIDIDSATVLNWIQNPVSNQGMIIVGDNENDVLTRHVTFASSQDATAANRPKLTVQCR